MQAVILAAGNGTRIQPLTKEMNKCMLPVANKPLVEYLLEQLPFFITEVIFIIRGGDKEIKNYFGNTYGFKKITYVEQKSSKGTGDALLQAKPLLRGWFVVFNGDTFYRKRDIKKCIRRRPSLLIARSKMAERYGVVTVDKTHVLSLVEKPKKADSDLINVGLYVLKRDMLEKKLLPAKSREYEIIDYLKPLISRKRLGYWETSFFVTITYPWDLFHATAEVLEDISLKKRGEVELHATLKGEVGIGEGTIVKDGSYIEGPVVIGKNCVIGPNCYIRGPTSIGDNCKIGNGVEIKSSVIFDHVNINHLSYIGDSLIGKHANIGAGTITANLRHDGDLIKVKTQGKLMDSGLKKLGAIIGDGVHLGIHTSIYPGRVVEKDTSPGEIVK